MERVTLIHGREPIIIVCPHAIDVPYLTIVTEELTKRSNAHAIINTGFQISDTVDVMKDEADCNRIDHILEDVVREEFLDPLLATKKNIARKYKRILVFYLEGLDKAVEQKAGTRIDVVLGYGQAVVNSSHTCPTWLVDMFINEWDAHGWTSSGIYCGKPGGKLSARSVNHLPQIFVKHYPDPNIQSMQLWISFRFLQDRGTAGFCGVMLANIIEEVTKADFFDEKIDKSYI